MITAQQRTIIKATIPLLETGGEALTTHFYAMLLRKHGDIRPLFNPAHQADGTQPRALANGVLMYAKHIDELETLGPLVNRIVQKHVALQILPAHYPIVGACLLRSIREVLGPDIATDDVIDAWGAAYGQLADILIGAEEGIYDAHERAPGGWRGGRYFTLARKQQESDEITSFYFEPEDGAPILDFTPGQYLGLRLNIDGEDVRRNYSLSARGNGKHYRISVKRAPEGRVSTYLHERLQVGERIECFPPAGAFTLEASEKPLVLITAGVGITPAVAMLEAALDTTRPIVFIHGTRHSRVQAFGPYIAQLAAAHPLLTSYVCYSQPLAEDRSDAIGYINRAMLADWLPADRDIDAYFLGPTAFMATIRHDLMALGVPASQCRYEFFGPAEALAA